MVDSRDLITLVRPSHWTKNAFVLAPLLFSQRLFELRDLRHAGIAFASFCMASSAAYVFNDILDRHRDRRHPFKCDRPLAAGRIKLGQAGALAGALAVLSVAGAATLEADVVVLVVAFLGLQGLYSIWLKHIVVVDVVALAAGFVVRAAAGVVAVAARMSPWLIVCTFLLALFLALAKRRHELFLLESDAGDHREVLGRYSVALLDQLIVIAAVTTLIAYVLYTLSPTVTAKLGTERLYLTVPFVVFGVFRYLFLVYGRQEGGSPTDVLLGDIPLQIGIFSWIAVVFLLLYQ